MKLADYLWLWGQDAGTHHAVIDKEGNPMWKIPGVNKMEPREGAEFLGIPNILKAMKSTQS